MYKVGVVVPKFPKNPIVDEKYIASDQLADGAAGYNHSSHARRGGPWHMWSKYDAILARLLTGDWHMGLTWQLMCQKVRSSFSIARSCLGSCVPTLSVTVQASDVSFLINGQFYLARVSFKTFRSTALPDFEVSGRNNYRTCNSR
jgi:hypothetical protein